MNSTTPKAVLFDLDGTLLDTAPDFIRTLNQLRVDYGMAELPNDLIRSQVSNGARALIQLGFGLQEGDPGFDDYLTTFLDRYLAALAVETRLFDDLDGVLVELEQRRIPWGVVTNKPSRYTDPLMHELALATRCAVSICPDHVQHRKPHPEPVLLACQRLEIAPSDTWYIGDHARDIEAGRRAGCTTVGVLWGYLDAQENPRDWGADHLISSPAQLARLMAIATPESQP